MIWALIITLLQCWTWSAWSSDIESDWVHILDKSQDESGNNLSTEDSQNDRLQIGQITRTNLPDDEAEKLEGLAASSDKQKQYLQSTAEALPRLKWISRELKEELMFNGYLAAAAYCPESSLYNWSCGERCQNTPGIKMIDYFRCEKLGVAGYVAVRKPTEELIVSFRGSDSFANWLYNLYISLDRVPWIYTVYQPEETAKVHEGFLLSYESVRREVLSHVSSAVEEYPGYSVKVIGHSLGGALANLCALDLRGVLSQEVAVRLMTYESPRVGDANFARLMRYQFPNALDRLRVTNGHDIVVHMPPYDLDYHHAAQEVFIPPDAHEQTLAYACDAENGEDPRCADAYLGCSVDDHLYIPWGLDFGSTCNGMGPSYPSSCD